MNKIFLILLPLLAACSGADNTNVPRPHAYPRTNIAVATYSPADSVRTIDFLINTAAAHISLKQNGCDIIYNNYDATIYITVIDNLDSPQKFNNAWQNRLERIDRNIAGMQKISTKLKNKTFDGLVIITPTVSQTPVQLLSANFDNHVIVSATAFMHNIIPTNAYDSIAPVYKALENDITKLALSLRCK